MDNANEQATATESPQAKPEEKNADLQVNPYVDEKPSEGSPLVVGIALAVVLLLVLLGAMILFNDPAPPIDEVRGKLYREIAASEDVESARRVSSSTISYFNQGREWNLRVQDMRVENGRGNLLVEVNAADGSETFNANVFAEPSGDGDEWRLIPNEEATGVERLWTRIAPREVEVRRQPAEDVVPPVETRITTGNPVVRMVTNEGVIVLELWEDHFPNSVANFISLVGQGFYDGTKFHRIIDGFMIQGGDPQTQAGLVPGQAGTGGPGYSIPDEISEHTDFNRPGLLAYANSGPNTSGSQFFITLDSTPHLNPSPTARYILFGEVIEGMDVVQAIGKSPVTRMGSSEASWPEREIEIIRAEIMEKRDHDYSFRKVD